MKELKTGQNLFNAIVENCDGFTPLQTDMQFIVSAVQEDNKDLIISHNPVSDAYMKKIAKDYAKDRSVGNDEQDKECEYDYLHGLRKMNNMINQ